MSQTPHAIAADHQTPTIGTAWSVEEGATRARHLFGGHIGGSPDGVWAAPDVSTSSASTPTTTTVSACQSPFPIAPTSLLDAVMTTRSSSSPSLTTAFSPGREPSTRSLLGRLLVGRPIPVVSRGRCVRPGMASGDSRLHWSRASPWVRDCRRRQPSSVASVWPSPTSTTLISPTLTPAVLASSMPPALRRTRLLRLPLEGSIKPLRCALPKVTPSSSTVTTGRFVKSPSTWPPPT